MLVSYHSLKILVTQEIMAKPKPPRDWTPQPRIITGVPEDDDVKQLRRAGPPGSDAVRTLQRKLNNQ